jgi:hypothetical protein
VARLLLTEQRGYQMRTSPIGVDQRDHKIPVGYIDSNEAARRLKLSPSSLRVYPNVWDRRISFGMAGVLSIESKMSKNMRGAATANCSASSSAMTGWSLAAQHGSGECAASAAAFKPPGKPPRKPA